MRTFWVRAQTFFLPLRIAYSLHKKGSLYTALQILIQTYMFLFWIGMGSRKSSVVNIYFNNKKIPIQLESSVDLALIREVFLDQEYKHSPLPQAAVIFDVGANVGVASLYFNALYPDATVYAFEPDPILFEKLKTRTQHLASIHPINAALSDVDGVIAFYSSRNRPLSGSITPRSPGDIKHTVPSRTIHGITTELNLKKIDLLKFDIEGAEGKLFSNEQGRKLISQLVGEVHLDLLGMSMDDFKKLLPGFRFDLICKTGTNRYVIHAVSKAGTVHELAEGVS